MAGRGLPKVLNVAEKNDAAKGIAGILSRGNSHRREGRSRYNKIYHFPFAFRGNQVDMIFTSVSGHLMTLDFVPEFKRWNQATCGTLFDAPVVANCITDGEPIKATLEQESRQANTLIIWTDCDREGENIGFEIVRVCQRVNPRLNVLRARFSEITPPAVNRALHNLVNPDERLSNAVDCRQELDLRIGASFTRLQTLNLQHRIAQLRTQEQNRVVSYGSCQFPTLGFVVERYKQVKDFIPEDFWKLRLIHVKDDLTTEFLWKRVRLFVKEACELYLDICEEQGEAVVESVEERPKSRWRPVPLETIELEKMAGKKLRMNARRAMNVAEKLYTKGFISYPRTETNKFPSDINLRNLAQLQTLDPSWGQFATDVLQRGPSPRNGNKSDQAHPPIHPTKAAQPGELQGDEAKLYEFVVRHFLACVSWDASGLETIVEVDMAEEKFAATGLQILDKGYLEVYSQYDQWSNRVISQYQRGERFHGNVSMIEGQTTAPNLLTEADLISLMDKHGIGTDATHADHIEKIKERMYVGVRHDNRFVPGHLGLGLVEGYDEMGFQMSKPHLRAELEADLKRICEGAKTKDDVLQVQLAKYRDIFIETERRVELLIRSVARNFGAHNNYQPPGAGPRMPPGGGGPGGDDGRGNPPPPPPASGNPPSCTCGNVSVLLTTKQGVNKGRKFYGCQAGRDQGCGFFKWEDEGKQKGNPPFPGEISNETTVCKCGISSVLRTTRQGENQGRKFFTCQKGRDQGCGFFKWEDEGKQKHNPQFFPTEIQHLPPVCQCGINSVLRTTRQGVNQGRRFFTCEKGRDQGCRFFKWEDEEKEKQNPPIVPSGCQNPPPLCQCGIDSVLRTTRQGVNQGRKFFTCQKGRDKGCKFFKWEDEQNQKENPRVNLSTPNRDQNQGEPPICNCGTYCVLGTTRQGSNEGRKFFTCLKGRNEGCKFFQWEDEPKHREYFAQPAPAQNVNPQPHCRCGVESVLRTTRQGVNQGRRFLACQKGREQGCGFFQWDNEQTQN